MVHSINYSLFHYAHDHHYQKATTISNFFAPIVELLSYIDLSRSIHTSIQYRYFVNESKQSILGADSVEASLALSALSLYWLIGAA